MSVFDSLIGFGTLSSVSRLSVKQSRRKPRRFCCAFWRVTPDFQVQPERNSMTSVGVISDAKNLDRAARNCSNTPSWYLSLRRVAGLRPSLRLAVASRPRSEEHTSELQSRQYLVCRLL